MLQIWWVADGYFADGRSRPARKVFSVAENKNYAAIQYFDEPGKREVVPLHGMYRSPSFDIGNSR